MKKILLIPLAIFSIKAMAQFTVTPSPYVAQNIDWIKYTGQKNSITNAPTAIDVNNSMWLTGYTGTNSPAYDVLTQKRDSLGNVVFTTTYDNGNYDKGNAIKLFGNNSYVAGVSYGNGATGLDYITLVYNQTGTQIASARYDRGTGSGGTDEAIDIKIDIYGYIYVTGKSMNTSGNYDIVTIKYSSALVQQWVHVFNGSANGNDLASGLTLSSNGGAVFVTGSSTNGSGNTDIVTYRLNSTNGTLAWSTITNGSGSGSNDKGNAIILSGANVVVAGEIYNNTTGLDQTTIKYDGGSGSIIFQEDYDYLNATNRGTSLVRDSTGNIATVGTALNGSQYEYHTVLLDSTGVQLFVNQEATGLTSLLSDPKVTCDTIAHHFYCVGEKMKTSRDIFVYQITPSGNTSWNLVIDGTGNSEVDAGTSISVNGIGVVYVGAQSKNSSANYDYTSIKISQTPVYFPPDPSTISNESPNVSHLFYENKGQIKRMDSLKVARDIVFSTLNNYPQSYYSTDRISYKFYKQEITNGSYDTTQRVDITMYNANKFTSAFPFQPKHGISHFMQSDLPAFVFDVKGYERYFVPNIYPSVDLHYYSNDQGLKMYYVLKPGANVKNIIWQISGATSHSITGNNLRINSFRGKVEFDQPTVYTVDWNGNPVTLTTTATWNSIGNGKYDLNVSPYNTAWPLIIEIDNGNGVVGSPSNADNLTHCTYYGGFEDDGIKAIDVDPSGESYAVLGETKASTNVNAFPIITGSFVTATSTLNNVSTRFLTLVVFSKTGNRLITNTYGIAGVQMNPLNLIMQGNYITVIGNTSSTLSPLLDNSSYNTQFPNTPVSLTPGTYTTTSGYGYAIQFHNNKSMPWYTRLNGYASDIARTPDRKHIYITTAINYDLTTDAKFQNGSYNNASYMQTSIYNFQISKFDSTGNRKWSTIWPVPNRTIKHTNRFNSQDNPASISLQSDDFLKCKIACDNHGFYLAGECDTTGMLVFSKYGAPTQSVHSGRIDAFYARFNKRDTVVYSSYVGGTADEAYTDVAVSGVNEGVMVGYCNSLNKQKIATPPNVNVYTDTTVTNGYSKILITKFDTIGTKKWSTYYGTNTQFSGDIAGWCVASDNAGKVFVSGKNLGTSLTFTATYNSNLYFTTGALNTEAFMLVFDVTNQPIWNTYFGGRSLDNGFGLAYNSNNSTLILVGMTNTTYSVELSAGADFPIKQNIANLSAWYQNKLNNTQIVYPQRDGYIATFSSWQIVGIKEYFSDQSNEDVFNLFPNPTQNECQMAFKKELKGKVSIRIFNQIGQLVTEQESNDIIPYSIVNINTRELIPGIYITKVSNSNGEYSKKLIITR